MSYPNPIVLLPSYARLLDLDAEQATALADVLRDLGDEADGQAEKSWRKHKGPMAAYWRAVGVYARHIARAVAPTVPPRNA